MPWLRTPEQAEVPYRIGNAVQRSRTRGQRCPRPGSYSRCRDRCRRRHTSGSVEALRRPCLPKALLPWAERWGVYQDRRRRRGSSGAYGLAERPLCYAETGRPRDGRGAGDAASSASGQGEDLRSADVRGHIEGRVPQGAIGEQRGRSWKRDRRHHDLHTSVGERIAIHNTSGRRTPAVRMGRRFRRLCPWGQGHLWGPRRAQRPILSYTGTAGVLRAQGHDGWLERGYELLQQARVRAAPIRRLRRFRLGADEVHAGARCADPPLVQGFRVWQDHGAAGLAVYLG